MHLQHWAHFHQAFASIKCIAWWKCVTVSVPFMYFAMIDVSAHTFKAMKFHIKLRKLFSSSSTRSIRWAKVLLRTWTRSSCFSWTSKWLWTTDLFYFYFILFYFFIHPASEHRAQSLAREYNIITDEWWEVINSLCICFVNCHLIVSHLADEC